MGMGMVMVALVSALGFGCANTGLGEATRSDVTARMATIAQPVASCYEAALKRDRKLKGTMVVAFDAEMNTGRFTNVKIKSSDLPDPELQTCVREQVSGLALAQATKAKVAIEYPLSFSPTN
jgi:hypothetical protein